MILHTCPHCNGSSLYPIDRRGSVNCHSCGKEFPLSAFSKADPDKGVRFVRAVRGTIHRAAKSRIVIYATAGLASLLVIWFAISVFGLIPDEMRIVNRRFAAPDDWSRVEQAVGLLAIGTPTGDGGIRFLAYGTAWSISNDGFMLTSKHVADGAALAALTAMEGVPGSPQPRLWVYLDKQRLDAELVSVDSVADLAIIKVDSDLPYRFRLASKSFMPRLNAEIVAVGFQELGVEVQSAVMNTPLRGTQGTISRVFSDAVGTHWIEHTAPIGQGSSGGPLFLDGIVVGMNTAGTDGIYRALALGPLRDRIASRVDEWRRARKRPEE